MYHSYISLDAEHWKKIIMRIDDMSGEKEVYLFCAH